MSRLDFIIHSWSFHLIPRRIFRKYECLRNGLARRGLAIYKAQTEATGERGQGIKYRAGIRGPLGAGGPPGIYWTVRCWDKAPLSPRRHSVSTPRLCLAHFFFIFPHSGEGWGTTLLPAPDTRPDCPQRACLFPPGGEHWWTGGTDLLWEGGGEKGGGWLVRQSGGWLDSLGRCRKQSEASTFI